MRNVGRSFDISNPLVYFNNEIHDFISTHSKFFHHTLSNESYNQLMFMITDGIKQMIDQDPAPLAVNKTDIDHIFRKKFDGETVTKDNVIKFFDEIFSPEKNDIKLVNITDISKDDNMKEAWFSGKALFIEHDELVGTNWK